MKLNKWTLGLIGAGLVSAPGVMQAEEATNAVPALLTSLSATTLSGYVDTSANWNLGTGNANLPKYTPNGVSGTTKADGFNLNVVALTLSKPVSGDTWSAGYNATLLFGPDAVGYNNSFGSPQTVSDFSLKDTYVTLHAPIGNGIDVKVGTFTEILGYEVYETGNNPDYTRSYGYMIEPTAMTGALATYQLTPEVLLTGGIANTWSAGVDARSNPPKAESYKTYMGMITFTCPTNFGFLSGSSVSGGLINGYDAVNGVIKTSWYVGGTLNTPITGVKVGFAEDYVNLAGNNINGANDSGYQEATGLYVNWQATEKLSFNTRGEYFAQSGYVATDPNGAGVGLPSKAFEVTETVQYDLWKNVMTRLEFRWDHAADDSSPWGNAQDNAYLLAANIIYKF
jgi:hypothetical protein